ncbi:hypothetical protein GCM10009789_41630 [Kribbella sancticallisti]|uniref:Uncharacterized protein n=1 Tax=Kribbella sancticallisti TaxID=460087 RepID=A0ABN2DQI3_9ACTN
MIDRWNLGDESRRIGTRARTVGNLFAVEQSLLKPPLCSVFETWRWDHTAGRPVLPGDHSHQPLLGPDAADRPPGQVSLNASDLVVYDGRTEVASHERLLAKGGSRLELEPTWRR